MNHRVYCVDSKDNNRKPFYDTAWKSKVDIVREISDLARLVDMLDLPEVPIWVFWLYKTEDDKRDAYESLEHIRTHFLKAVDDRLERENDHSQHAYKLDYLPKKKIKSTARCFAIFIGYLR